MFETSETSVLCYCVIYSIVEEILHENIFVAVGQFYNKVNFIIIIFCIQVILSPLQPFQFCTLKIPHLLR